MEAGTIEKYTIDDLRIGMWVSDSQLTCVYDTHIVLINAEVKNNEIWGNIGFIGKRLNQESDKLNQLNTVVADIYNSSSDVEDDVILLTMKST